MHRALQINNSGGARGYNKAGLLLKGPNNHENTMFSLLYWDWVVRDY